MNNRDILFRIIGERFYLDHYIKQLKPISNLVYIFTDRVTGLVLCLSFNVGRRTGEEIIELSYF